MKKGIIFIAFAVLWTLNLKAQTIGATTAATPSESDQTFIFKTQNGSSLKITRKTTIGEILALKANIRDTSIIPSSGSAWRNGNFYRLTGTSYLYFFGMNGNRLDFQAPLSFKTINGNTITGSGDIAISGGSGGITQSALNDTATSIRNNINYVASNVAANYATKSEIGKGSAVYYYVNKRTDVDAATQDAQAVRASTVATYRNIFLARNAAIMDIRNNVVAAAVVYVYSGNEVRVAEDTCTKYSNIDYRVPVSDSSVMFYGNYKSDTTATRTTNLAFRNLSYIFENNTKIWNFCASRSIIAREGISYTTKNLYEGSIMSNFSFTNLNYESFYGQTEGKESQELAANSSYTKNVKFAFNDFITRRGHNTYSISCQDPIFEVNGKYFSRVNENYFNSYDTAYSNMYLNINDYRIGETFTQDQSFYMLDGWSGLYLASATNKNLMLKFNTLKIDDNTQLISLGSGSNSITKSNINIDIQSFKQRYMRETHTDAYSNYSSTIALYGNTRIGNKVNITAKTWDAEQAILLSRNNVMDSMQINIAIQNATFDSRNSTTLTTMSPFVLNNGRSNNFVVKVTGKYTCNGYASMFRIDGGKGTYIIDGDFTTIDDKPIVVVGSGFTGKIILNGRLVVGQNVTSPTANVVSGTGTVLVNNVTSNTAVGASITQVGGTISVNSAFKF